MDESGSPLAIAAYAAGVPLEEIMTLLEINRPWAWDLFTDREDDEINTLSLGQLHLLAARLQVPATSLVYQTPGPARQQASFEELAAHARAFFEDHQLTVGEFGEQTGWELKAFFDSPASAANDWNLECLKDVCSTLAQHWPDYFGGWDNPSSDFRGQSEDGADSAVWKYTAVQQFLRVDGPDDCISPALAEVLSAPCVPSVTGPNLKE